MSTAGTLLDKPVDDHRARLLLAACEGDQSLAESLTPFAWVIRNDLRGLPMVIPVGAIYVTEVSQRRDTGAQYTSRELAEEVARYALEPLVYSPGPATEPTPQTGSRSRRSKSSPCGSAIRQSAQERS